MKKVLPAVLIILAIVFLAVAVYYWVTPASSLPSFFPGHQADYNQPHVKHGIAAAVVGVACAILAWFLTGKTSSNSGTTAGPTTTPPTTPSV